MRQSPVLVRMAVSYATLVVVVAVALSTFSFAYFQKKYDHELETLHSVLLDNMQKEIRTEVLDVAKTLYMTLVMDVVTPSGAYFSADDGREGNAEKLYWTHRQLQELVIRHSPAVEAIHLYYHRSEIFLSSIKGVKYESTSYETGRGRLWRDLLVKRKEKALWLDGPEGPFSQGSLMSLQVYPILAEPENAELLVAVEFRVDALRAILDRFTNRNTGMTMLADAAGHVVAASANAEPWTAKQVVAALGAPEADRLGGFVRTMGGVPSLVTVHPVEGSDWFLINGTPLDQLHQKDGELFLVLLLISLGVVLLGLGVSVPLLFRQYSPLERLAQRVRAAFGPHVRSAEGADEYQMIDSALEGLSAALQANRPVIQHEFVSRLLEGAPMEQADFDDTLRLLELPPFPSRCVTADLHLFEGGWVAKFRLLEELERGGGPLLLVTPLEGNHLGLIVDASDPERLGDVARGWVELAREVCGTAVGVFFGPEAVSPFSLGPSFAEARRLAEFRFFYPELTVFLGRRDLLGDTGPAALPEGVLAGLTEALRLRHPAKVDDALEDVTRFVRTAGVTPERSRSELYRVARVVGNAVTEARVATGEELSRRLEVLLAEARDLVEWKTSVRVLVADLFAQIENRTEDRTTLLIERVRGYVAEHLADELSLDRVSAAVSLSPSYLSKLFKEATGVNFVAFVTEARLKQAEELLRQSRATIQEIGRLVGFHTPAYFIHQFRSRYGVTPYDFRRQLPQK